jgi:hypothetical protein
MSLMTTVTSIALSFTDVAALEAEFLGDATRQESRESLALLFAVHDRLVQESQLLEGALVSRAHSLGQLDEDGLDLGVDRLGRQSS